MFLKVRKFLFLILSLFILTGCFENVPDGMFFIPSREFTIGSNKAGSVFFLLANGFSKHIQKNLGIRSNAQPHAGSSVYLPLVNNGEVTIGVNNALDIGSAVRGKPPFRKKLSFYNNFRKLSSTALIASS